MAGLGFPVVLKVLSADTLHKSDIGGVRLWTADRVAAEASFDEILTASRNAEPDVSIDGCLVAPMVTGGVETILGVQRDPVFGAIAMFELGGIFVEALENVTFRAAALSRLSQFDAAAFVSINSLDLNPLPRPRRRPPHPSPTARPPPRRLPQLSPTASDSGPH